jgi:glutathione S-transferase
MAAVTVRNPGTAEVLGEVPASDAAQVAATVERALQGQRAMAATPAHERADLLRWLFWEQYNHEPNIATVRFWRTLVGEENLTDLQRALLPGKLAAGNAALALMDEHLGRSDYLVLARLTLADLVLYAYTHVAGEGGFDLQPYPNVRAWLARVASHPAHIPISA